MNKSKIILASVGGVIAVAVLAMAYFVWSGYAAKVAAVAFMPTRATLCGAW